MHSELDVLSHKRLTVAIALCMAATLVQSAEAQEQNAPAQQRPEEIVVTGSYLQRPVNRPQPVTVLGSNDLKLSQRTTVAEVFKDLPQVTGSVSTINTAEGGNSPTATVNLRGLGPRATLVLLNGERQTTDGGIGAVDINNLTPSIMIQRIEILTDGASALYGSDAVAGVVNFITRNNFDGVELSYEAQKIQDTSANRPDTKFSALVGSQGETTGVVAGFEYSTTETLLVEDRYNDARLLDTLQSGFANPGSFTNLTTHQRMPDPLCGSDLIGGGLRAGFVNPVNHNQCMLANSLGRALQPESKRLVGLAELHHDFGHNVNGQLEMGFARTRYKIAFGFVTPLLFPLPFVPATNPGVIFAHQMDPSFPIADYQFWGRPLSPAGGSAEQNYHYTEQNTFRLAAKLDGRFGEKWDWRASVVDSWNDLSFTSIDTFSDRYTDALQGYGGPNCKASPATDPTGALAGQGDCHWWNPFANHLLAQPGDPAYNDMSLANWFLGSRIDKESGELKTAQFVSTGQLWEMAGGTTGLALGYEYRQQAFGQKWDNVSHDGGWRFNSDPYEDFSGVRDTNAMFAELDMFPTKTLELQLAARTEDYGQISSTDPKLGILWTPGKRWFVRASAGSSFRQPGELQTFGQGPGGSSVRVIGGDAIQARASLTGNPNLKPETSDSWTLGFTWEATDRFTMDLNYWNVDFKNLVTQEDADVILAQDMADGYITDPRIVLRAGSSNKVCEFFDPSYKGGDPNCMSGFDVRVFNLTYFNQDYQETSGLDFRFNYKFDALNSQWGLSLTGAYTTKYKLTTTGVTIDALGSYNTDNFGAPDPKLRANLALDWTHGNNYIRATLRHISKLTEDSPNNPLSEEKPFDTVDIVYDYTLAGGKVDITGAMINAFDKEDPIRQNALQTTTSEIYDVRGRVFRVGANVSF